MESKRGSLPPKEGNLTCMKVHIEGMCDYSEQCNTVLTLAVKVC